MEYLFRGFHPDKNGSKTITLNGKKIRGEWVEGSLIQTYIEYSDGRTETDCEIHEKHIGVDIESFYGGYMSGCEEVVISETVGLWTELTDRIGNKIFDGDIIFDHSQERKLVVLWDRRTCRFVRSETTNTNDNKWYSINDIFDEEGCEVIGNKWENAELLEVEV